jgi:hypothetical protein
MIGDFLIAFQALYAKHRHGAKYLIRRPKDIVLVRTLLDQYGLDRLVKLATILLTTDEQWIAKTDRGIGILVVKASWLDSLLAEHEAKRKSRLA